MTSAIFYTFRNTELIQGNLVEIQDKRNTREKSQGETKEKTKGKKERKPLIIQGDYVKIGLNQEKPYK